MDFGQYTQEQVFDKISAKKANAYSNVFLNSFFLLVILFAAAAALGLIGGAL